jgi:RHS repeat-associated protein
VREAAKQMGRDLISPNNYHQEWDDIEYVRRLYETFLRFAPDQPGWDYWVGELKGQGRNGVLEAFMDAGAYREQSDALYREIFWLVGDHLGTTRMIAERTGSLAGIKRHDYLPFGEEIAANVGARNVTGNGSNAFGYVDDSARQQFTGHERDEETGLDYMQARHYGSALGRFVSVDTVGGKATDPQTLNLYAYVNNNPLKYTDPTGHAKQKERREDHPDEPEWISWEHSGREVIAAAEAEFDQLAAEAIDNSRIKAALKDDGSSSSDSTSSSESTDSSKESESSGGDVTVSAEITGVEPEDNISAEVYYFRLLTKPILARSFS